MAKPAIKDILGVCAIWGTDYYLWDRDNQKHFLEGFQHSNNYKEALQNLTRIIGEERADEAKAFGGCRICYGKGYATYKTSAGGYATDGDIGGPEGPFRQDLPVEMRYCECDRGKQLKKLIGEIRGRRQTNEA